VLAAARDVAEAREHGRQTAEWAAQVRLDAHVEALEILEKSRG
jgi:hypothetical protein